MSGALQLLLVDNLQTCAKNSENRDFRWSSAAAFAWEVWEEWRFSWNEPPALKRKKKKKKKPKLRMVSCCGGFPHAVEGAFRRAEKFPRRDHKIYVQGLK